MLHLLAVVACLLMPLLCAALPTWNILPRWITLDAPRARTAQSPGTPVPGVRTAANPPIENKTTTAPPPPPPEVSPTRHEVSSRPTPPPHSPSIWIWIASVWIVSALSLLLPLLIGRVMLRRLTRRAGPGEKETAALLSQLRAELNVKRRVRLLQLRECRMPMVFGILRPTILIPQDMPVSQQRPVLLHELAHIKRNDCLTQLLAQLACAIYWFNPLVWYAARRMRIERERACDDLVLSAGSPPTDYAEQLLRIAAGARHHNMAAFAGIAMARQSTLEGRLLAILDERRNRKTLTRFAVALSAILLACVVVPVAMLRAQTPAESQITEPETQSKAAPPPGSRFEKIAPLRKALAARPHHPDNITIEFELAGHIENSVPTHNEAKRLAMLAEARGIYEHIVNTYDHMSYYTKYGPGTPHSPELLVPYAAVHLGFRHGGEKGRKYHHRAMICLKQTTERRKKDWQVEAKPAFDPDSPFAGPVEKSKWESRVHAWEQRRRGAAPGDVLTASELQCAQSAVRGYVETFKPEQAGKALREIIRDFDGTPIAGIARRELRPKQTVIKVLADGSYALEDGRRRLQAHEVVLVLRKGAIDKTLPIVIDYDERADLSKVVSLLEALQDNGFGQLHLATNRARDRQALHGNVEFIATTATDNEITHSWIIKRSEISKVFAGWAHQRTDGTLAESVGVGGNNRLGAHIIRLSLTVKREGEFVVWKTKREELAPGESDGVTMSSKTHIGPNAQLRIHELGPTMQLDTTAYRALFQIDVMSKGKRQARLSYVARMAPPDEPYPGVLTQKDPVKKIVPMSERVPSKPPMPSAALHGEDVTR